MLNLALRAADAARPGGVRASVVIGSDVRGHLSALGSDRTSDAAQHRRSHGANGFLERPRLNVGTLFALLRCSFREVALREKRRECPLRARDARCNATQELRRGALCSRSNWFFLSVLHNAFVVRAIVDRAIQKASNHNAFEDCRSNQPKA